MSKKPLTVRKEICVYCRNTSGVKWEQTDETNWEEGTVMCPPGYCEDDDKTPPVRCPYRVEHMLETQELPE